MLIRAAGAVAWRPGPDGAEVLLVHRAKYDDWSLPKGKVEPGEPLPVTACREVGEEGGAAITLGQRLAAVRYKVNGNPKQVDWWVARVMSVDDSAVPNHEVDQVTWLPLAQALKRVSYKQDVSVLSDFAAVSADTVPLILLRHAKALPRSEWYSDDGDRPLDKAGMIDATTLAPLLSCFAPVAEVVTSPAVRCLDTVRPYADLSGSKVRVEPALAPSAIQGSGADSYSLISALVAAETPAIVCGHRENLPALLDVALTAAGAVAPERAEPPQWAGDQDKPTARRAAGQRAAVIEGVRVLEAVTRPLPKGDFLVLHLTGGTLAGIDRYELS
jgi:8-oxo-dGTP pyrophosphatase MutT (NUDIX family)/phosphohistidine phosphatase SixA